MRLFKVKKSSNPLPESGAFYQLPEETTNIDEKKTGYQEVQRHFNYKSVIARVAQVSPWNKSGNG